MSSTASGSGNSSRYLDFDEYVDLKLQKTRSTIKTTDILVALAGVAAMFLGYLLVFVIFDQWVVPGGFSIGLRWLLLSTLLLLTGAWLGWKVGSPYLRSVNRLFAANEIEKADTDLKSNLLNLVDLRASGREVDPAILRALEKNAAVGLQKIDVAQAIDHRPLMRIAYVLLAVVVLFCLYALFSPKKISNSIWRSLLPAAKLAVATQTEIVAVHPGDDTVPARRSVDFWADIAGDVPDKVWLHYSTADGKFQDEPIELRTDSDAPTRFKGPLPSVVQNLSYVVRAGDAVSHRYHITVSQPPSATVDRVRFQFPAYMKLEETEFAGGQIDAWDGTTVSLTAHTNMPVKTATIQFLDTAEAGPNSDDVAVLVSRDGQQLTASWKLGFRSDGTYSRLYQIRCTTESGATDPTPIRYAITIRPDLAPEVSIIEPVRDMDVPSNTILPLLIEARDPDFQLSQVNLHVKKNGQQVQKESLLSTPQQRLLAKHDLKLDRLQVKPGDTVELWVQAFDNRQPRPNSKVTPELKLKIVDPLSEKDAQQKLANDQANRDQRLKDAEQEQNQEGRPDQKTGAGEPGDPQPRDLKDPERRDPQPRQKDPTAKDEPSPKENTSPDQTGDSGKTKNTAGGKDNKPTGTGQQKGDKNQSGTSENKPPQETPLNSDGEDDDKALEKLINSLKKPQEKQPNQNKEQQGDGNTDERKTEPKSETSNAGNEGAPQPTQEPKQPENKPDQTGANTKAPKPSNDKTQQANPKKPSEQDQPKPDPASPPQTKPNQDSSSNGEPKQPMPGNQGAKKPENSGTKPNESPQPNANKPDKSGKTNEKQDNPKEKSPMDQGAGAKPKPDPIQNKDDATGAGEAPKPEKINDGGEEGKDPKTTPKPGGEGNEPGGTEKPEPGAGPMDGTEGPMGNGGETEKAADPPKNAQAGGEPGKPKPATGDGTGEEKEGPSADGPEEQASPSSNAKKKTADGTETGTAMPDNDPGANPTKSDNPDLKRDPNEKPATQSREATAQESNDPAKQAADNKVKTPKPQPGGAEKQKIEQTGDGEKTPPGNNPQKQQGEPNAANEPQQGSKQKDPRSKQGAGGQSGSSKEDQAGDPGSSSSGQGDAADRPGKQQPTKENSKEAGGENKPGAGKESSAGGDKNPGSKEKQDGSSKDGGGKKSDQNAAGKSNGEGAGKDGAGKDGAAGGQPGEGSTGGKPGATAEGSSPSGAASPPGTGRNTGSSKPRPGKQGDTLVEGRPDGKAEPVEANDSGSTPEGEEANLEYKKQATELVLKRLQDELERGEVDPELLEKLGWTKDELRRFSDRLNKALAESKSGDETPESLSRRQQFEEMLKGLDVNKSGTKRSGENSPQREVNQIESRHSTVPKAYRAASEKLSREVSRQKKATAK